MKIPAVFLLLCPFGAFAQGPLPPPAGPPVASMKTLDQIESRTAIPQGPAVPVVGPHFTITQPGSYYLTGNVTVSGGNGININASNVTLDLNGFSLISNTVSPAAGRAISIASNLRNIEIENGHISGGAVRTPGAQPWGGTYADLGWRTGISDDASARSSGVILSHLTVDQCKGTGIQIFGISVMVHIHATSNGSDGIANTGGSVSDVSVSYNGGSGISSQDAIVTNVSAIYNGSDGISAYTGRVSDVSVSSNGGDGINATNGSVSNASARSNGGDGIDVPSGSVSNASASNNGLNGIAGIGSSVTHCRATGNGRSGIKVTSGVAAHCVASGNSTNAATTDKEIDVAPDGQRDACVPAAE